MYQCNIFVVVLSSCCLFVVLVVVCFVVLVVTLFYRIALFLPANAAFVKYLSGVVSPVSLSL